MHTAFQSTIDADQLLKLLRNYRWRWVVPTVFVTASAAAFALLKPVEWEASQALAIRNEAANNAEGPGKFGHSDQRRTAQETVLELAKSRSVLAAAMESVGPPADWQSEAGAWPGEQEVDDFLGKVTLAPPKGAELGTAEVFRLAVRDGDRQRAVALVAAICDQLDASYQRLRDATAASMMEELRQAVAIARAELDTATAKVSATEAEVGEDLGDLRTLHQSISGDSALQRRATQIRDEIRGILAVFRSNQELLRLLDEAQDDPTRLVSTPNRLIESQPGLRRLKEGLIDAQLETATLLGRMSETHPLVVAARESEEEVRRQIRRELGEAISSLQLEFRLNSDELAGLRQQLQEIDERLGRLAQVRVRYSAQLTDVQNRSELIRRAEEEFSRASIARAGSTSSLLVRIDVPTAGTRPVGPGRTLIVLVGLVAGLLCGLGTVVLTAPYTAAESETEPAGAARAEFDYPMVQQETVPPLQPLSKPLDRPFAATAATPVEPLPEPAAHPADATTATAMWPHRTRGNRALVEKLPAPAIDLDLLLAPPMVDPARAGGLTLREALQRVAVAPEPS